MDDRDASPATSAFSPAIPRRLCTRAPLYRHGRQIRQEDREVGSAARAGAHDVLALGARHALLLATA
jgi:hypothetical protein